MKLKASDAAQAALNAGKVSALGRSVEDDNGSEDDAYSVAHRSFSGQALRPYQPVTRGRPWINAMRASSTDESSPKSSTSHNELGLIVTAQESHAETNALGTWANKIVIKSSRTAKILEDRTLLPSPKTDKLSRATRNPMPTP